METTINELIAILFYQLFFTVHQDIRRSPSEIDGELIITVKATVKLRTSERVYILTINHSSDNNSYLIANSYIDGVERKIQWNSDAAITLSMLLNLLNKY